MAGASRVVVLAFVMFAMIGVACAADKSAPAPTAGGDAAADSDDYSIGAITSGAATSPSGVVAGPIGGPVPPGAFDNAKGTDPSASAATSSFHHFSALAGAASAALAGYFYF